MPQRVERCAIKLASSQNNEVTATTVPAEHHRTKGALRFRIDADSDVKPATIPIKIRPVFGTEDTPWVSNLASITRDERGHFDAGKEKADHETIKTNASACRKRDELPRDRRRIGNSAQYGGRV